MHVFHIPAAEHNIVSPKRIRAEKGATLVSNPGNPGTPVCMGRVQAKTRDGTLIVAYFRPGLLPDSASELCTVRRNAS
jgi:hypothetical protein